VTHKLRTLVFSSAAALSLIWQAGPLQANPAPGSPAPASRDFNTAETAAGNFLAALTAESNRDPSAAAHYFREALRSDPRNGELRERAFIAHLQDGNMPEAFRMAERILRTDADNALANLAMGVRALRNRQFQSARGHFLKAGGKGRNADLTASLLVGWTHVGSGETTRALAVVDRFNSNDMAIFRNYFGGLMADVGGNKPEAAKRLKAAHLTDSGTIRIADAYARFEARHGDKDAAKAIYDSFMDNSGQKAFIMQPRQEIIDGKTPDPLVTSSLRGGAEVLYTAADIGGRRGTEMLSIIYLQLANHLNSESDVVLATLAENFEQAKQFDRAIDIYNRVPDESGLGSRAAMRAALALDASNRTDEGLKLIEERITKAPFDYLLHDTAAGIYRGKKRWAEAIEASSLAIALIETPQRVHWSLFYGRGISYERAKQWEKAEADFKKALSLLPVDPKSPSDQYNVAHVLNYIGYSWVDMRMNIDEAFVMLKRAVELQPRDGYIIDSLGWAYYRLGQYEEATRELERAVDLKPADATLNDHLGDAYWKVGRREEAKFQWNHARDLKPEPEELEKILRKISNGLEEPKSAESVPVQAGSPASEAPPTIKRDGG
jgi:tetratricopeptide (TPR) repeat protein